MANDISVYCIKYNCGKCCERGWDIFVTEEDIVRWQTRPEILEQIGTKIIEGKERKLLNKREVKLKNGKIKKLCVFYDLESKCLIHDVNPAICRNFSCLKHPFFLFQLFHKISQFIEEAT